MNAVAANIYQALKQAIQDLVAPQLESLKGDLAGMKGELVGMKGELGGVRLDIQRVEEKLTSEIQRVDEKLSADIRRVEEKLTSEIRRVDGDVHRIDEKLTWALDLRERIIVLETKLGSSGSGA